MLIGYSHDVDLNANEGHQYLRHFLLNNSEDGSTQVKCLSTMKFLADGPVSFDQRLAMMDVNLDTHDALVGKLMSTSKEEQSLVLNCK